MAPRQKTITMVPDAAEPAQEVLGQGKRPDKGQFRLQVDRQTKATVRDLRGCRKAGLAIKRGPTHSSGRCLRHDRRHQ